MVFIVLLTNPSALWGKRRVPHILPIICQQMLSLLQPAYAAYAAYDPDPTAGIIREPDLH